MRVIKLSPKDPDMSNRAMVDAYFHQVLQERTPAGQFLLTRGRISKDGIQSDERIVFTYLGEVTYQARSLTGRLENSDKAASERYPHYFCVNLDSIQEGAKSLHELEDELKNANLIPADQNLVKSQGWPIVEESNEPALSRVLQRFLK